MEDFIKKFVNNFFLYPDNQTVLSSLLSSNLIIVIRRDIKKIIKDILEKNLGKINNMYKKQHQGVGYYEYSKDYDNSL